MRHSKRLLLLAALAAAPSMSLISPSVSHAAIPLFLNEGNCVSGDQFLKSSSSAGSDTGPLIGPLHSGKLQGNGQNWLELVVGDPGNGTHSVDLRGYKLEWAEYKDSTDFGSGRITFNDNRNSFYTPNGVYDWSNRAEGTVIGINEWSNVYYDSHGNRSGGLDGFNLQHNTLAGTYHLDESTNTAGYNPSGGSWIANLYAGDNNGSSGATANGTGSGSSAESFYFTFTGMTETSGTPSYVGDTSDPNKVAGLFVVNNNDWALTVLDGNNNIVGVAVGENQPHWNDPGSTGAGKGGVSNNNVIKLEPGEYSLHGVGTNGYGAMTNLDYDGGKSSTYMAPNVWTDDTGTGYSSQALTSLQNWSGVPTHW